MSWQLLIFISVIFEALGRITQRVIMKGEKSDPISTAIIYQFIASLFFVIASGFVGFSIPDIRPLVPFLLLTPIFWGGGNIFVFRSLKTTEASVFTVLFALRTLVVIVLSLLLLGESFSLLQVIGALLILGAVILVSWKKEQMKLKRGELFALIAAVFIACGIINDSYIVRTVPVLPYLAYNFFTSALFVWLLHPSRTKRVVTTLQEKAIMWKAILLAFIFAVAAGTSVYAYQVGNNAAQLGAIYPVSNILVVLLAIVFLKERSSIVKKIAAVIISVIGVILIS